MAFVPNVVFDLEDVIHSYSSGYQGTTVIPDPPVPGIREAIRDIMDTGYRVVVVSTRCAEPEGLEAVKEYLKKHDIVVSDVMAEKPPSIYFEDDRASCFDGDDSSLLHKVMHFNPSICYVDDRAICFDGDASSLLHKSSLGIKKKIEVHHGSEHEAYP